MTINGLMTQRTPFLYAMPMSRTRENFVTEKQARAAGGAQRRTTAAERSAGDSWFVDRLPKKDNSTKTAQNVAATQSSLANWAMQNPSTSSRATPAVERTPGSRRAVVEQTRAEVRRSASTLQNLTSKIFSTQINGYAAARNYESWSPDPAAKTTVPGADAVQEAQDRKAAADADTRAARPDTFTINADTPEEAEKAVSEDGYWGAAQTSERIVKYARALTGGDSSKVDAMEQAFEAGYQEAAKAWGGDMPAVAQQTREAVLNQFQQMRQVSAAAVQGLAATA